MKFPSRHRLDAGSDRGFVLVAVLWLLAGLALLVTIFTVHLSASTHAIALNDDALRREALVSAGVELAAYRLLAADDKRPTEGRFQIRLSGADMTVSFVTEAARIDLNEAPKELLSGFFGVLGAGEDAAKQIAERIVAWRTKASSDADGAKEAALYQAAGRAYSPRLGPFPHVNELSLVLGMTPALVERALPYVTVFSSLPGVDVMVAPAEVIAALPGMTPLKLRQFLSDRTSLAAEVDALSAGAGGVKAGADNGRPQQPKSQAYRVQVAVRFADRREAMSEVVIALIPTDVPYRVLSWQDDVPFAQQARAEF